MNTHTIALVAEPLHGFLYHETEHRENPDVFLGFTSTAVTWPVWPDAQPEMVSGIGRELVRTPPDEEGNPLFSTHDTPLFGLPTEVEDCSDVTKGSWRAFTANNHSLYVLVLKLLFPLFFYIFTYNILSLWSRIEKRNSRNHFQLFFTRHYEDVSYDDIIKATNISKGGLYHYAPNKIELFPVGL